MQFHLNGYRPGDSDISATVEHLDGSIDDGCLPEQVDVLIVGCGPAGLTLAAQLATFPSISTRIVDQKAGPLQRGQADGIFCSGSNEGEHIFEMRCIKRKTDCIVLVRPDQHVAHVLPLNAYSELAAFFDGFMIEMDQ